MEPTTVGQLHDKVLRCPYCGHQLDVPDEVTVRRVETVEPFTDASGRIVSRRREVVVTRRDGGAPRGSSSPFDAGTGAASAAATGLTGDDLEDYVRRTAGDEAADALSSALRDGLDGELVVEDDAVRTERVVVSSTADEVTLSALDDLHRGAVAGRRRARLLMVVVILGAALMLLGVTLCVLLVLALA